MQGWPRHGLGQSANSPEPAVVESALCRPLQLTSCSTRSLTPPLSHGFVSRGVVVGLNVLRGPFTTSAAKCSYEYALFSDAGGGYPSPTSMSSSAPALWAPSCSKFRAGSPHSLPDQKRGRCRSCCLASRLPRNFHVSPLGSDKPSCTQSSYSQCFPRSRGIWP